MTNNFGGYLPQDERLRQQIADIQAQWDLLTQKLARLEKDLILETHTDEKFRLEHLIRELRTEREQIEQQLRDLETQLSEGSDRAKMAQDQTMPVVIKEVKTMDLTVTLRRQIVDFLKSLPNIHDPAKRQALLYSANLDPQLLSQISFTGAAEEFFQILLPTLIKYGRLNDGRPALQAVLEAAKEFVGNDGRMACDNLIRALGWLPSAYQVPGSASRTPEHAALKKEAARLETLLANHETMLKRLQLMESKYVDPPLELLNKKMAKEEEITQITAQLEELKRKLAL